MFLPKEFNKLEMETFTRNVKIWLLISLSFGKTMEVVVMKFSFVSIIDKESEIRRYHFASFFGVGAPQSQSKPRLKPRSSQLKN